MVAVGRSQVLSGWVRHRRYQPTVHAFGYHMHLIGLDLATAQSIECCPWYGFRRPALIRFHRPDYMDGVDDLRCAIHDRVEQELGWRPDGAVRLITQLRWLGLAFNPVSFYVCQNQAGVPEAVVAEITNTPWGERYAYVIDLRVGRSSTFAKVFHVSPFHDIDQRYRWSFAWSGQSLIIHMQNFEDDELVFDATFAVQSKPATARRLFDIAWRRPVSPLLTLAAIYRQAWALFRKRIPFYDHPKHGQAARSESCSVMHPETMPRSLT